MNAEHLVVLRVGHDLYKPGRCAQDRRLAIGRERELPGLHLITTLTSFRLAEPNAGNLRIAVGAGWDLAIVNRLWMMPCDLLSCNDTLSRSLMRQPGSCLNTVADRIDIIDVGLHQAIDFDIATV